MYKWFSQKHLLAACTVGVLLLAVSTPRGMVDVPREGNRYLLPGDTLPTVDYDNLLATTVPVRRMKDALASPLEAAAERLRPFAQLMFPSLWDAPRPAQPAQPYAVRDTALRLVRETL